MPDAPNDAHPLVVLPDEVCLTLGEAGTVLGALDRGHAVVAPGDRAANRRAIRVVTAKLWPELGRLLDEDEG